MPLTNKKTPQIDRYDFHDLVNVMRKLRDPDGGCPWDLEQDFKSIAPYTIEEAYEVADAIEREDMKDLREELGDLLLQPLYHAQMASEAAEFDIQDVIHDITAKMISRHPHVFADQNAEAAKDVDAIWEERKAQEYGDTHILDTVTIGLPALLRAYKLQKKAAKTGFEWSDVKDILSKLKEEINELEQGVKRKDKTNIEEEIGDIFFVLVNLAKHYDVNPETALRQTNNKFVKRFKKMEELIKKKKKKFSDLTVEEMIAAWNEGKKILESA